MNALRTMKLRTKLLTAFLLGAVLTLVMGFFGIRELHKIEESGIEMYENVTVPLGLIGDISTSFQRIRVNMAVMAGTTDKAVQKEMADGIVKLRERIGEKLKEFDKSMKTSDEKQDMAAMAQARQNYIQVQEEVLALAMAGKEEQAQHLLQGAGRKAADEYRKVIDRMVEHKTEKARNTRDKNEKEADQATLLLSALMGVVFLASIVLGLVITANISGQLGEDPGYLSEVAGKIAGGDLNVAFRPQRKKGGVYAVLQDMVATMKGKIAEAEQKTAEAAEQARLAKIATDEANAAKAAAERAKAEGMIAAAGQLERVVEVVSSASEELSAQIEQSSRGTEVQSQRVAETATAMEEMNATVLEVAKNASQASDSAGNARLKALDGAKIVAQVVSGIGTMQAVSLAMKEDMGVLGKQAEGIGAIMNVISDIADQTNLLALNAAIEAARAGDAGRGFAVVADEVRKLAEKTMTATKEVGEAINGIQQGTRKNLQNVDRAVSTIEQATGLANQSGEALKEIVHLVEVATDQVRSIATASEEQSSASEEINRSVEEINRISSETASAMNQSAQAVGEMAAQAGKLRELIEKLKSGG